MPIKQESPNPIVLVLCRTNQVKVIRNNYPIVKTLTKICDIKLPLGYTVLAESDEIVDYLFTSNIIRMIEALNNTIEKIYITDQVKLIEQYPITMTSTFIYPTDNKDINHIKIQAELVIALSDLINKLNLSQKAKTIAYKERENLNKDKLKEIKQQREDERLQKKVEQKKKEEEKIQGLSKEKQRKLEEKNYKKELKKKGLKFKMIKG